MSERRFGRSVNRVERPLPHLLLIPLVPPLPPCGTGDTTAPGPAALFLPAARTGGLFMIAMGQGEAAQAARTATSGGA